MYLNTMITIDFIPLSLFILDPTKDSFMPLTYTSYRSHIGWNSLQCVTLLVTHKHYRDNINSNQLKYCNIKMRIRLTCVRVCVGWARRKGWCVCGLVICTQGCKRQTNTQTCTTEPWHWNVAKRILARKEKYTKKQIYKYVYITNKYKKTMFKHKHSRSWTEKKNEENLILLVVVRTYSRIL